MQPGENSGWHEWSRHVLIELKRLDQDIKELKELVIQQRVDIIILKAKAAMIGAIAGALPSAVIFLWQTFHK
jgi:hypothetical protein